MNNLGRLSDLRAITTVHGDQVERTLAWKENLDTFDAASHELPLLDPRVLIPWHEALASKRLLLAAEVMATVLSHEVLMPLEEVENEVVHLRVVRLPKMLSLLLLIAVLAQQMLLLERVELPKIGFLVKEAFSLQLLPLDLFLGKLRDTILPILRIPAEDTLVENVTAIIA